jgi:hypothetical protein
MSKAPPPAASESARRFQWFLLLGLVMRLAMLNQPLFNNSNLRQTQTATITRSLVAFGGCSLSGEVNWMGDLKARLLLELPLYNYLVLAVHALHVPLDGAGKLVSVALWAISFLLLQGILRYVLNEEQTCWANLLFALAPLSVYFGQAFLPEMLIQVLSFAMLVLLLRYLERPKLHTFVGLSLTGAVGMLLKGPEVSHLYLVAAAMLVATELLPAVRQSGTPSTGSSADAVPIAAVSPIVTLLRCSAALGLTALAMVVWGRYIDRVNSTWFAEWTSKNVLGLMMGSWKAHIEPVGYIRLLIYIGLLATTLGGLPWVVVGLLKVLSREGMRDASSLVGETPATTNPGARKFVFAWLGSLLFYYVFWAGGASRIHAYYNLPALGPVCLLFGIGCTSWLRGGWAARFPTTARLAPALLIIATAVGPYWFLFHNDPVLIQATTWLKEHTAPADLILVRVNHRTDMCRYRHNSTVAYYAQRNIWPWVDDEAREVKDRALATASWALVTHPEHATGWTEKLRRRFKQLEPQVEDMTWLERDAGFVKVYDTEQFTVYKRR